MVVDFHFHVIHPALVRETGNRNVMHGWGAREARPPDPEGLRRVAGMADPGVALDDMDQRGIDVAVLSASMVLQTSAWADALHQAEFERASNELVADRVVSRPERFVGLGTLPLKDTDLALAELDRLTANGLRGVNLPAQVDGDYLGAPRFHSIWEAIRDRELVAFIHPDGARDMWFQQYALWNSVGQPIEEAKALASLILEGVLERYPGLKIVVSHGGGYLPHYVGRLDRNVTNMPDSVRNLSRAPSEYLRELFFDTCVYDVGTLEALVHRYGADHIVMGSDYPVGERDPVAFVRRALDGAALEKVTGGNAARLLQL
jgi:aminocarboxymuconate-semialdehyde decarboxylase